MTESAVCGVRGTDFVLDSIGVLAVKDGAVEFSSLLSNETINVVAGQIADVFAETFAATAATAQSLASIFSGMDFDGADPAQVPGHTVVQDEPSSEPADDTEADEAGGDESADDKSADEPSGDDEAPQADDGDQADDEGTPAEEAPQQPKPVVQGSAAASITGKTVPSADRKKDEADDAPAEPSEPGPFDEFFEGLGDLLAFEVGSITIDGTTYAKAVVQPEFELGDFRMGLYLPVIYQDNLFDPTSWYKPAGNNEWSFGTDQTDLGPILLDIVSDLFLKIKYIQYGDNGDSFYLKFGNLDNMTIGHGILMYNFANNNEFPAVRKVGLNTGMRFENFGFEAVVDDAADPSIFGGRLVYIPFGSGFPLGFGLSAITDINPDSELETTPELFDTVVLNGAFDIGLPLDMLGLTLFADIAALTMYDAAGWHLETVYNTAEPDILKALNNFGISTGVYGDLFDFLDYRLEYRLNKGLFRPAFYGSSYLADKTTYFNDLTTFTQDPSLESYQKITMGVYGELSANIFDIVTLEGGYLWPWAFDGATLDLSARDYFHIAAYLMPDVIPVAGIYGSVSYTRTGLNTSIADAAGGADFMLFDESTVFTGELVYPFDDSLDIALQFSTALRRDEYGNIDLSSGNAEVYYAFTIDTRISF